MIFKWLLLEDKSNFPMLLDVLRKDTTSTLEILHWFYQMIQLWELLERVDCRQSLLELSNLRLDEDQAVVLQRLYLEPEDEQQTLTIKSLAQMWQSLFQESQHTQFDPVLKILADLESGHIQTLIELRLACSSAALSQVEKIATEVEELFAQEQPTFSSTVLQAGAEIENKHDDAPTMVLSMQLSSLEYAAYTHVGRQRDHNEDYFGVDSQVHKLELPKHSTVTAQGLYILCDGMGGHAGGEIASELAVKTIQQYFQETWLDTDGITSQGKYPSRSLLSQSSHL